VRRTPRYLVVALPVVLVAASLWLHSASSRRLAAAAPTIEPSLPLSIEMTHLPPDPIRGLPHRLQATVDAARDLQDVSLRLVLPEDVTADADPLDGGRPMTLRAGERRTYESPLQARRAGSYPIKILATFRLQDGRVFHTQQGILWRNGNTPAPAEGRHHAGAYEWMAVPVAEPQP